MKLSKETYEDTRRAFRALDLIGEVKEELERQRKWLFKAGYNAYNIDVAFDTIKSLLKEGEQETSSDMTKEGGYYGEVQNTK
jgi:hypothetical protein